MASVSPPDSAPVPPAGRRPRLSRQAYIAVGLLLSIVGLFLTAVLFPTAPGSLGVVLPVAAVGLVALWLGGILMGIGSRS